MNSNRLKKYARSLGLDCLGITSSELIIPAEGKKICPLAAGQGIERYTPQALLKNCRAVIVVLFPYYVPTAEPSNLSIYTQSLDYHLIIQNYLKLLQHFMEQEYPQSNHYLCADTSPLCDRYLAHQAGLGFIGDNNCFIHPIYGSYCFIGSLLTTVPLIPDKPLTKECFHCGACRKICPGNCFINSDYNYECCKSYLTQKKGDLTPPEIAIIKKTSLIFGCDECQRVCPHNRYIPITPISEFRKDRILQLRRTELLSLTNTQFRRTYGNRAFAWRGKSILLRNLEYMDKEL